MPITIEFSSILEVRESPKIVLSAAVFWQERSFHIASVSLRKARDEHMFSAPPPIAAGSKPFQYLRSAP